MVSISRRSAAGSSEKTARSGCMARACASAIPGRKPRRSAAAETATSSSTLPRLAVTARQAGFTSPWRGEVGECRRREPGGGEAKSPHPAAFGGDPPPPGEGERPTRSVESRFSHRLTIRWCIATLFHTIELQHPCSERTATVAGEADAKTRRAGTARHRDCAGGRARWRRADEEARRRRGGLVRRRAAQQQREGAAAAGREREPARCEKIDAGADLAEDGAGAAGTAGTAGAGQRLLHGPQHVAGFRCPNRDQPLGGKAEILEPRPIGRAVLGERHVLGDPHHGASIAGGKDQRKAGRGGDFRLAGRGDLVERAGCKPPAERRIEGGNAERKGAFVGSYLGKFERHRPAQVCEHAMRGGRGGQGKFSIRRSEHGRRSPCGVFLENPPAWLCSWFVPIDSRSWVNLQALFWGGFRGVGAACRIGQASANKEFGHGIHFSSGWRAWPRIPSASVVHTLQRRLAKLQLGARDVLLARGN